MSDGRLVPDKPQNSGKTTHSWVAKVSLKCFNIIFDTQLVIKYHGITKYWMDWSLMIWTCCN